jgi:hypothetical protein
VSALVGTSFQLLGRFPVDWPAGPAFP